MLLIRQFLICKNERGLLFKKGDFSGFLMPGTYHYFDPFHHIQVERYDLTEPLFSHRLIDFLLIKHADTIEHYFTVVDLNAQQVALVYKNGQLFDILSPATRTVYWKGLVEITIKIIDILTEFKIDPETASSLVYAQTGVLPQRVKAFIHSREVPEHHVGLLYVNGQYLNTLSPGLHAYWHFNRHIQIELWDTRLQDIEVSGQEILTKDKVNLRLNLSASYQIKDILQVTAKLTHLNAYLYKELQFGLRAAVGTRTLDELLENKNVIDELVFSYITEKTKELGVKIQAVGVKDIILPGEMKTILSKVVEAEKVAQANLIKRREETAATRSLLNTAKVMEDNPTALRLKELEMLEKVTEKVDNISVYSGLDGLLKELVTMK